MASSSRVEFEGIISATSAKAVLFQGDYWNEPAWVPRSQCEILPQTGDDESGRAILYIEKWLVKSNGWE